MMVVQTGCVREVDDDLAAFAPGNDSDQTSGGPGSTETADDGEGSDTAAGTGDDLSDGAADGADESDAGSGDAGGDEGSGGESSDGDAAEDGASGDAGSDDTGLPCNELVLSLEKPVPEVMFVLDASGSMSTLMAGTSQSRWATLHSVVVPVVQSLGWEVAFGLQLFPLQTTCGVPAPGALPTLDGGASLLAVLPSPMLQVSGATPTATALNQTYELLLSDPDVVAPTVILVTDGGVSTSCGSPNTEPDLVELVAQATDAGIKTWIVAIDPSGTLHDHLNALAEAGGTAQGGLPKFLEAQDGPALAQAIATATEDLIPCGLKLPEIPPYPELVDLRIDGVTQPKLQSCSDASGFVLTGPVDAPDGLTLCPMSCELAKQGGAIEVSYGCVPG